MRNIVSRAGLELTSLAFRASVLPLHHVGSLPLYPRPPVYVALCLRGPCRLLHLSSWNCKSFNTYNFIHTAIHIHTEGRFNKHTTHSLNKIMVTATSVMGVTKIENIVLRAGLKTTSLAFRTSVLRLHHVSSLMSPLYPHPPAYVALYLRGQCRLLQDYAALI